MLHRISLKIYMNKVCIAIPTKDGNIYFELALRLIQWSSQKTIPVQLMFQPFSSPIDHARNDIVRRFLDTDCTHLMMIDDDIVPPLEALERLLFHDQDIIGAICPLIGPDKHGGLRVSWNAYGKDKGIYDDIEDDCDAGLLPVDAVGTGCIMIKRHVFEDGKLLFKTVFDDTGIKWQGEDINFCEEAKNLGAHVFADFKLKCKHIKSCNLLELYD